MDDVPEDEKLRRLQEVISAFRSNIQIKNDAIVRMSNLGITDSRLLPSGTESSSTADPVYMVVLVEGHAKRSTPEAPYWTGRSDGNQRCVFPDTTLPIFTDLKALGKGIFGIESYGAISIIHLSEELSELEAATNHVVKPGDYVLVLPEKAQSTTFR